MEVIIAGATSLTRTGPTKASVADRGVVESSRPLGLVRRAAGYAERTPVEPEELLVTYKHVTLTGEADTIEGAVKSALEVSGEAVTGQSWLEVKDIRASLVDGARIEAFQVTIAVAFAVDESKIKS